MFSSPTFANKPEGFCEEVGSFLVEEFLIK
jgi:hypothetical protein